MKDYDSTPITNKEVIFKMIENENYIFNLIPSDYYKEESFVNQLMQLTPNKMKYKIFNCLKGEFGEEFIIKEIQKDPFTILHLNKDILKNAKIEQHIQDNIWNYREKDIIEHLVRRDVKLGNYFLDLVLNF